MKTAMQELIELLKKEDINLPNLITLVFIEKEKKQIINFVNSFYDNCITEGGSIKQSAEEYYNQTYNHVRDESEEAFKHFADNADITITFNRNS